MGILVRQTIPQVSNEWATYNVMYIQIYEHAKSYLSFFAANSVYICA